MHPSAKSRLIARTELRRSLRAFRTNRYQLLATGAFTILFLGPILVFGSLAAYGFGESPAAGSSPEIDPLPVVRAGVAGCWVLVAFLVASRSIGKTATVDESEGILTAVPVQTALGGVLLSEALLVGSWVVPPILVVGGAFALGAGNPLVLVTTMLALAFVLASAVPVGYLLGLGIRHLLTVNETLARYKTAIGIAAFVLYFGAIAFVESLFADLFSMVGRLPMGWLGDLALSGVPGLAPSLVRATGAAGLSALLGTLAVVGATRLAALHWFADTARDSRPTARVKARDSRLPALDGVLAQPTRAVARVGWLRARRAPIRLLYTAYPLFGLVVFAGDLSGVLFYLPIVLTLYVIWAAGAAVTLNPLGDQAGALAATLTTPVSGGRFVRGHLLVGAAVFVPLGLLASVASAAFVGYSVEQVVLLGAASVLGVLGATALASGVGAAFPRFGAVRLSGSHEAVMPSKSAFVAYSLAIGLTVVAMVLVYSELARTVLALVATGLVLDRFALALTPSGVFTGAVIGLIGLLALPALAYVYAARTFDRFTIS